MTPATKDALEALDKMLKHLNIPPELQSEKLTGYIETIRQALSHLLGPRSPKI